MGHETDRDEADEPAAPSLEQCFVFFDGCLKANSNGRKRFEDRFRRAGFDIERISTFDELEIALIGSWHIVMSDMEREFEQTSAGKDSLDHRAMRAWFRGDYDEVKRLQDKRRRIKQLGLNVVSDKGPDDRA
jgi:hypothetical protein